jgi:penicillin-binding protein 1A
MGAPPPGTKDGRPPLGETSARDHRSPLKSILDTIRGTMAGGSIQRRVLTEGATVLAVGLLTAGAIYGAILTVRPTIDQGADLYALNRPASFTFVDRNGGLLGHAGPNVGERLKLSEMPPYLPAAFLAMEDRNFYRHTGIDPKGLLRAIAIDIKAGKAVAGGSTITQQLVKVLFLTPERTMTRKLRELGGAWTLERKLSKNQILELYLNRIYLGSGAYGVDGASRLYFGKSAREVTLQEAAMLAALTRSPSVFSPRRDLPKAQQRANLVLDAMVGTGGTTLAQAEKGKAHPATIADHEEDLARSYFFDAAASEVKRVIPGVAGDLTVTTTFDAVMQEAARKSLTSVMDRRGKAMRAGQAALVAMSPDGALRAMVGGRDYSDSQFNRITDAKRQPGSAFKLFVYLTALESGLSPWSVRDDSVTDVDGYAPENYDDKHFGQVTLKDALVRSLNTIAIKLQQEVGARAIIRTAQRLGITSPLHSYASLALGTSEVTPLELVSAYATLPAGGIRVTPYSVEEVRTPTGDVLYRHQPPAPVRVIAQDKLLTMNAMLNEVVLYGTGRAAALPNREVAGKTGTSSEFRDAWFVGYSNELVAAVWVGNDDFKPMKKVTGGSLPAQIWNGFMTVALQPYPPTPLPKMLPPDPNQFDYVAYADPADGIAPTQTEENGYYIEMPGFVRDLFGDGNERRDGNRDTAQSPNGDRSTQTRDDAEQREIARVQRDIQNTGQPPAPPATRPDTSASGDLEGQRRTLVEREREAQERYRGAPAVGPRDPRYDPYAERDRMPPPRPLARRDEMPRDQFGRRDPYAERDQVDETPRRFANRRQPEYDDMPPVGPAPDGDFDPGMFGEMPPPPPPPEPWFSMPFR